MPTSILPARSHAKNPSDFRDFVPCSPIVKWAGGKGRLLHQLTQRLPEGAEYKRHIEPFAGGAALFFAHAPKRAMLCDVNPALIHAYQSVRDAVEDVIVELQRLAKRHSTIHYYQVREQYNQSRQVLNTEHAARFIYLNKTCFNGLHRVNRQGEFNVPLGRYSNPRIIDEENLREASRRLKRVQLECMDFRDLPTIGRDEDFFYLDPPYAPISATANFTSYSLAGFSWQDQTELGDVFRALDSKGAKLMLSNSDVPLIHRIYEGYRIERILAPRAINCKGEARRPVPELIIRNY
ncbi:MAG: DNA adenine methylase [Myxococcales bacterium]|nr:DNA adenine methylase [Myxococcales bacterium]MCB9707988.1 DNA adenine methylase [Myxococcales bacterium]